MSPRTHVCLRVGLRIVKLERLLQLDELDTPCETCSACPGGSCRSADGLPKGTCWSRTKRGRTAELLVLRAMLETKCVNHGNSKKMPEKIIAAALRYEDKIYSLPPPARHDSVILMMATLGIPAEGMRDQGFVTDLNRFVDRSEAAIIATQAEQLIRKTFPTDLLFSEDVW